MNIRYLIPLICATSSLVTIVHAEGLKPAPVKLGFAELVPVLTVKEEYDSNLYRQNDAPVESWVQVMMLQMKAQALDGPHVYALNYQGEAGFIDADSADNYVDQAATLNGKWDANSRHRFELLGGYLQDHDRRGTEYFQGDQAQLIDEPARFHQETFLGRYSYGAKQARGRLDFEVKGVDKTYMNFRELTEQNDAANIYGSATFLWRMAGSLHALVETTQGNVNYHDDPAELDGIEDARDSDYAAYLAGVTWELAGKTTGTLKVGRATKDFTDEDREDFSGTSWSGDLTWHPRSYSRLTLSTGRRAAESYGRGDYIDATDWGVAWDHDWSDRITAGIRYRQSDETYEADPQNRDDTIYRYGFTANYTVRRWLVLGMFYTREKRDSNLAQFDFPRDFAGLVLRASL